MTCFLNFAIFVLLSCSSRLATHVTVFTVSSPCCIRACFNNFLLIELIPNHQLVAFIITFLIIAQLSSNSLKTKLDVSSLIIYDIKEYYFHINMSSLSDTPIRTNKSPAASFRFIIYISATFVLIILVGFLIFTIIPKRVPLSQLSPSPTPAPLESCGVRKGDYPLVSKVTTYPIGTLGRYQGIITNITYDTNKKPHMITIISLDHKQTHTFDVTRAIGHFHSSKGDDYDLTTLMPGIHISIGFVCLVSENFQFRLSDVGLEEEK